MLNYILLGLAALVVILIAVIATRPADFRIARTVMMRGPASAAFALVNDFHNWQAWSPFVKYDPHAKLSFEGPSSGVGAKYSWDGNSKAGAGMCTIIESQPSEFARMRLEFLRPFKATNTAEFTFQPQGDQTAVIWSMSGKNGFMGKAFSLVMNCDKMIGKDFEEGLASMKRLVEQAPRPTAKAPA
jgi:hypothetical protein